MRKAILILGLLLLAMLPAAPAKAGQASPPTVRVGLWANQTSIILSAADGFSLADTDSKELLGSYRAKEKVMITFGASGIAVNGRPVAARALTAFLPAKSVAGIEVNRREYRGTVSIRRTAGKNGLTVVNTLSLEEYVYGIIAREISPAWPAEAVKAQAVAARTYALNSLGKHKDDGYDVCATTHCQVYGGKTAEDARATKAVDDTRGLVVTYKGEPVPAYFHGSGGGFTENSENVWGGFHPALRGVADYDQGSPHYRWEKQMSLKEVETALESAGIMVGSLQAIELSPLTKPPVSSRDRGVSGRVKDIRLVGSSGSTVVSGTKLRTVLGLNSTLFDIKVTLPAKKAVEFEITDSYGDRDTKTVPISVKPLPDKSDNPDIRRVSGRANETIVFTGFGWGHGIGLSQWGARAMAEKAPAGDTAYFRTILKHYYTGVEISKLY
ncbi:SpoIID/LytB domain-containing protein [Anaeroselena agilis]|uniref:SpoIID/LytB domain-containing protein n=1 Tax=Anaeroselena agilis TaxID=3063788 RepID=A0ABU3NW20_9FIRM|nr:SpoIID/LytB domain-containing protein [Selenomonadales bacterium 4137-cl]